MAVDLRRWRPVQAVPPATGPGSAGPPEPAGGQGDLCCSRGGER